MPGHNAIPLDLVQAGIHNVRERHTGTVDHFGDQRGDYFTPAHGRRSRPHSGHGLHKDLAGNNTDLHSLQVFFTIDGLTRSQQVLIAPRISGKQTYTCTAQLLIQPIHDGRIRSRHFKKFLFTIKKEWCL